MSVEDAAAELPVCDEQGLLPHTCSVFYARLLDTPLLTAGVLFPPYTHELAALVQDYCKSWTSSSIRHRRACGECRLLKPWQL